MACVTDLANGWQLCGIAVNPPQVGAPVEAGFTLGVTDMAVGSYAGVVTDAGGVVHMTFPAQTFDSTETAFPAGGATPVPPYANVWVQFRSTQTVDPSLAGLQLVVVLGPADLFAGVGVGDTFTLYAGYALAAAVTVPGGAAAPGGGQTGGGGQAPGQAYITVLHVDLAPSTVQPGQPVTATVIVGNEGVGPGSATVVGSDTLGRTWGPVGTGTIPPGGSVTLTLTSGPTPATAAGQTVSVGFTIQGGSQPAVSNTFSVAARSTTTGTPTPRTPAQDYVIAAVVGVGLIAVIAGLASR
jgi:hypothetical protein